MNLLQAWLVVGVPGLLLLAGLLTGRSRFRAWLGYGVLASLLVVFGVLVGDVVSSAAIGLIGFVLVASGRGTHLDDDVPEHHENRKRFTTDPSHA